MFYHEWRQPVYDLPFEGILEVGVIKHHRRTLPTKLERHTLEVAFRGHLLHGLASRDAACKADLGHLHVRRKRGARGPVTSQDLEHAWWKSSLEYEFAEFCCHEWRLLAGLEDEDVACGEGWGGLETD